MQVRSSFSVPVPTSCSSSPPLVLSVNGSYVESVETRLGLFHAVVFDALQGEQWATDELAPDMFAAWGKALGNLHNASQGHPGTGRATWQEHLLSIATHLPQGERAALAQLRKLQEQLSQLPTNARACGLIHFDFELDNVIWTDLGAEIIDFDESAWYWFVADIAVALRDVFEDDPDNVDLTNDRLRRFVAGYRKVRKLAEEDLELLPLYLRLHNMLSFAKLYRTIGTENPHDGPLWVVNLRNKLTAKRNSYQARFSEDTH